MVRRGARFFKDCVRRLLQSRAEDEEGGDGTEVQLSSEARMEVQPMQKDHRRSLTNKEEPSSLFR